MPGKPEAPHGTEAAFRRHKRRGEPPCKACQEAHDGFNESRRVAARIRDAGEPTEDVAASGKVPVEKPVVPGSEGKSRIADLYALRTFLFSATAKSWNAGEMGKLPTLSRELRETWREIESLENVNAPAETDEWDEFLNDSTPSNVVGFPTAQDRKTS